MIRRTILFDNQCGFALGENSRAPNPFVTWQFNGQDGHRDYFWGHYMNEPDMAERDLLNRARDYQRRYHVEEVEQAPDKETYLYYSTQRPVDIGTFPKPPHNAPDEIVNYEGRVWVENDTRLAWGHLTYTKPLTEKQAADYELRPAPVISELRRESGGRPRPIAEQLKAAQREAQENKAPDGPKKKAPDRGDR